MSTFRVSRKEIREICCDCREYGNKSKYPYINYLSFDQAPSAEFIAMDNDCYIEKQNTLHLHHTNQSLPTLSDMRLSKDILADLCKPKYGQNITRIKREMICNVECYWVFSAQSSIDNGLIIMCHGGGYCKDSALQDFGLAEHLSQLTQFKCLLINYSLAPQCPLPYAVRQVHRVYQHCIKHFNLSNKQIVLNGESAGGGLVLLLLQYIVKMNDEAIGVPLCVYVNSPWTNLGCDSPSIDRNARYDSVINTFHLQLFPQWAVGNKTEDMKVINTNDVKNEMFSPLFANWNCRDKAFAFCPIYFMVGATECILDDTLQLAQMLWSNGVQCTVDIHPYMFHAWPIFQTLPEARTATRKIAQWILAQHRKHKGTMMANTASKL
eukprot:246805_1